MPDLPDNPEDDAFTVRAWLQGLLAGTCMRPDFPLRVAALYNPVRDGRGPYGDSFVVATESGLRFRVSVEVDDA